MFENNERCTKGKVYLPLSLVDMIFYYFHVSSYIGGHPGYSRTLSKINEKFYSLNLAMLIKERVKNVKFVKWLNPFKEGMKVTKVIPSKHLEILIQKLYIYTAGPLTTSATGNRRILFVVDDCTKYVWSTPVRDVTSTFIIKNL